MILLKNATLIDGNGAPPRGGMHVLINEQRIVSITSSTDTPVPSENVQEINLAGKYLLPGFIDCHVHILFDPDPKAIPLVGPGAPYRLTLRGAQNARLTLEAGFTTVADMMSPNEAIFALRDAIAAGEIPGPRIIASGKCITITGGHGTQYGLDAYIEADGEQEVFKAVRQQIKAGADTIKLMASRPALSPPYRGREAYQAEEMIPGIKEAQRAGLRVHAHAHSIVSAIRQAVLAGVDSVEHCAPVNEEVIKMMRDQGTFMVPTLSVSAGLEESIRDGSFPYGEKAMQRSLGLAQETSEAVALAYKRGVPLALGTDASMPYVWHGKNAREFELLVNCGVSPMDALVAGTSAAAKNLGIFHETGNIAIGKLADLVVVDGDPLKDIRILQDPNAIKLVLKAGQVAVNRF